MKKQIQKIRMLFKKLDNFIVMNRKTPLFISGIVGIILSYYAYHVFCYLLPNADRLQTNITILALSLPTIFLLWLFRTYDIQEQIKKAEENNQFNNFSNAIKLFL